MDTLRFCCVGIYDCICMLTTLFNCYYIIFIAIARQVTQGSLTQVGVNPQIPPNVGRTSFRTFSSAKVAPMPIRYTLHSTVMIIIVINIYSACNITFVCTAQISKCFGSSTNISSHDAVN